jgi:MPBQ/MSBQ methyltransferase
MSLIQHKKAAYWFYRFVSLGYDRLNPRFWNQTMRSEALQLAQLDRSDLTVVDVGAGTGFTTVGVVEKVHPDQVTMLDQSPHQLAQSRQREQLDRCKKVLGDAENLPFPTDTFDRYVSAGSIEYWPHPQRAITEAYRLLKPGGIALIVGPLQRRNLLARLLSASWMLFPSQADYAQWFEQAGFTDIRQLHLAPAWYQKAGKTGYAIAIAGSKPEPGASPLLLESEGDRPLPLLRAVQALGNAWASTIGAMAGLIFVPLALAFEGTLFKILFLI